MKKIKLPPALIIVYIFLLIIAVFTWFVPVSVVMENPTTGVQEIHYNAQLDDEGVLIEDYGTKPAGIWDVFLAPVLGFQAASDVIYAILIAGAFLTLLAHVGALDAGIGVLIKNFSGGVLIAILMFVFSLMGTVFGTWEELVVYALAVVPLFCLAGYDVMTGLLVLFVGATVGNMASIINPFSKGAAAAAIGNPEYSMGDGILLNITIFVVLQIIATIFVIRYASKVKADKSKSVISDLTDVNTLSDQKTEMPKMNGKRAWSLAVFILIILSTVVGYFPWYIIPWGDATMYEAINSVQTNLAANVPWLANFLGTASFTNWGDWYFNEYSVMFTIGFVIVVCINRVSLVEAVQIFVRGSKDLLGVCLVLGVARGMSIIMGSKTSGMSVTFVYWIQNTLAGIPPWAFVIGCVIAFMLIGLFIQSTSGVAAITMPVLGAATAAIFATASFGSVGGLIMLVSSYTLGLNFMSAVYPSATVMGTLDLVNVPYDRYLKIMLSICVPLLLVGTLIISLAPYLGLLG